MLSCLLGGSLWWICSYPKTATVDQRPFPNCWIAEFYSSRWGHSHWGCHRSWNPSRKRESLFRRWATVYWMFGQKYLSQGKSLTCWCLTFLHCWLSHQKCNIQPWGSDVTLHLGSPWRVLCLLWRLHAPCSISHLTPPWTHFFTVLMVCHIFFTIKSLWMNNTGVLSPRYLIIHTHTVVPR